MTVVVATRNRARELLRTLDRLGRLPERPAVIVVDNGSTDGTVTAVRRHHPGVEVVALPENRGCAARNVGARHAATPVVAFSDDDSWWAPGALEHAAGLLAAHPRLALLAARVLVGPDQRLDPVSASMRASPLPHQPDLPGPPVLGFLACGAVVRRAAFLGVGGFERRLLIGGEEALLAMELARSGWGLAYADGVIAHHHPSTVRDPARRRVQVTRNTLLTVWLRRRLPTAARHTLQILGRGVRDPAVRRGLLGASAALPWALRARRPVPRWLEADLRLLEAG